jgi:hypothetical protein
MLTSRIRTSCKAAFTSKVHHRGVDLMDQLRHALVVERVARIARRMMIRVAVERRVGEHHSGITKSPVVEVIREVDTWMERGALAETIGRSPPANIARLTERTSAG